MTLLIVVAALFAAAAAHAQTFPKLTGRVVDAANLLSPDQEAQLDQLSQSIEQASSRQLVVATIPDLEGRAIDDYGYQLGRAWGIGQSKINNGIILIVAPNEKKVRIEVGYGLEPIMTDALSNMIIQNDVLPKFRDGNMPGGIIAGANAIAEQLKAPPEEAEQKVAQAAAASRQQSQSGDKGGFPFALVFWLIVFGFMMASRIWGRRHGKRYRGGMWPIFLWGSGFGGGGGGGGSGFGGGGFGGGGGGFSGGGGSFGGGGASGGW
ncbi:methanol dehydrogenase [Sphingomonas koreensis]|nr:methanol dehydrogenase [Sphingomonas koreensis]